MSKQNIPFSDGIDRDIMFSFSEYGALRNEQEDFCRMLYGCVQNGVCCISQDGCIFVFPNGRAVNITFDLDDMRHVTNVSAYTFFEKDGKFFPDSENELNGTSIKTAEDMVSALDKVKDLEKVEEIEYIRIMEDNSDKISRTYPEFSKFIAENALCIDENLNSRVITFESGNGLVISGDKIIPFESVGSTMVPSWGTYGKLGELSDEKLVKLSESLESGDMEEYRQLKCRLFYSGEMSTEEYLRDYNVCNFLIKTDDSILEYHDIYNQIGINYENVVSKDSDEIKFIKSIIDIEGNRINCIETIKESDSGALESNAVISVISKDGEVLLCETLNQDDFYMIGESSSEIDSKIYSLRQEYLTGDRVTLLCDESYLYDDSFWENGGYDSLIEHDEATVLDSEPIWDDGFEPDIL